MNTESWISHVGSSYLFFTPSHSHLFFPRFRRIYRRGFTECISAVMSALGYPPLLGNSKFDLRVRSLPRVIAEPLFDPNLDSTAQVRNVPFEANKG